MKIFNNIEMKKLEHLKQWLNENANIMIKITRMIRYLLLQFVNIADGDLSTKLSGVLKKIQPTEVLI